jgi:hypothetical protein
MMKMQRIFAAMLKHFCTAFIIQKGISLDWTPQVFQKG